MWLKILHEYPSLKILENEKERPSEQKGPGKHQEANRLGGLGDQVRREKWRDEQGAQPNGLLT